MSVKSVALVGAAGSSVLAKDTPADDIWTMNHIAMLSEEGFMHLGELKYPLKKVDLLMEIHNEHEIKQPSLGKMGVRYWNWLLREHPFPIMMKEKNSRVPSSERYPLEDVKTLIKGEIYVGDERKDEVFGSSMDYLFALALYRGYTDIYFYGATYGLETEYRYQLGGTHFWFGMANQMGVNLHFPPGDNFFEQKSYGYHAWVRITPKQIRKDLRKVKELHRQSSLEQEVRYRGMIQWMEHVLNKLDGKGSLGREELEVALIDTRSQHSGFIALHNQNPSQRTWDNVLLAEGHYHAVLNYKNECNLLPQDLEPKPLAVREEE